MPLSHSMNDEQKHDVIVEPEGSITAQLDAGFDEIDASNDTETDTAGDEDFTTKIMSMYNEMGGAKTKKDNESKKDPWKGILMTVTAEAGRLGRVLAALDCCPVSSEPREGAPAAKATLPPWLTPPAVVRRETKEINITAIFQRFSAPVLKKVIELNDAAGGLYKKWGVGIYNYSVIDNSIYIGPRENTANNNKSLQAIIPHLPLCLFNINYERVIYHAALCALCLEASLMINDNMFWSWIRQTKYKALDKPFQASILANMNMTTPRHIIRQHTFYCLPRIKVEIFKREVTTLDEIGDRYSAFLDMDIIEQRAGKWLEWAKCMPEELSLSAEDNF